MAGFKDAHTKRTLTERVGSQVAEVFHSYQLRGHGVRTTAMLGVAIKLVDYQIARVHGNSSKAKEGNRLVGELLRVQHELEVFFREHCGELPE